MTATLPKTIADALPGLDKEQLAALASRISFLANPTGTATEIVAPDGSSTTTADEALVYFEMQGFLSPSRRNLPLPVLLANKSMGPTFRSGVKVLMRFVRDEFNPPCQVDTVRIVRVLLACVVKSIKRKGYPAGPRTISQGMCRIADIVDTAFPGYLSAGLLPMLLKTHGR